MEATDTQFIERKSFSKIPAFVDVPDLLSVQTKAYQKFLQEYVPPEARKPIGLEGVLRSVFPIEDSHRNYILEYKSYFLGQPNLNDSKSPLPAAALIFDADIPETPVASGSRSPALTTSIVL